MADVVFAAFALFVVGMYTMRGAVRSLFGILSVVVAGVAAYLLGPKVGSTLITPLLYGVEDTVYEMLVSTAASAGGAVDPDTLLAQLPSMFSGMENVVRNTFGEVVATTEESLRAVAHTIAEPVVTYVSHTIGSILVFAAVSVLMFFVGRLIRPLLRLKLLKKADRTVGAVLGIVAAFVYLWVLCLVLGLLMQCGVFRQMQAVSQALSTSVVFRFFGGLSPLGALNMAAMLI